MNEIYFFHFYILPYENNNNNNHINKINNLINNNNYHYIHENLYWKSLLNSSSINYQNNYYNLGLLRREYKVDINLNIDLFHISTSTTTTSSITSNNDNSKSNSKENNIKIIVSLELLKSSSYIGFMILLTLKYNINHELYKLNQHEFKTINNSNNHIDNRVLPCWYSNNYITLLPGDMLHNIIIETNIPFINSNKYDNIDNYRNITSSLLYIEVDGWNVNKQIFYIL
jgi:hypothetical protein